MWHLDPTLGTGLSSTRCCAAEAGAPRVGLGWQTNAGSPEDSPDLRGSQGHPGTRADARRFEASQRAGG